MPLIIDKPKFRKKSINKQLQIAEIRIQYNEIEREIKQDEINEKIFAQLPYSSRWLPILEKGIKPLSGQRYDYWHSQKRFNVVAAGARSLKTEIGKRRLVRAAVRATPDEFGARRYCFAAPVNLQAKAIAWDDLIALCPKERIANINKSDLCITLTNTATEIWIAGFDNPARIEGRSWDGLHLTEYADMPNGIWGAHIRPLVADRNGWITLEGRPDRNAPNNDNFKELFNYGLDGSKEEWASFRWKSIDIISEEELNSMLETMTEDQAREETEGSFESTHDAAYNEFSFAQNVEETEFLERKPIHLSCDFNYGYHNWLLIQTQPNGHVNVIDQIFLTNATVESMCVATDDKLKELANGKTYPDGMPLYSKGRDVVLYGDYSGEQKRAEATYSSWRQIKNFFPKAEPKYKVQPPIADRITSVNSYLRNAKKETRLHISPKAKNLITDMEKVTRVMLFTQNKSDSLTHASDALGYFLIQKDRADYIKKALS